MEEWKLEPAHDLDLTGIERYRSYRRESGLVESTLRLGWWGMLRSGYTLWNRLQVIGRDHLPAEPPFVLVANHTSHVDALVLTCVLPLHWRDVVYPLAAKDVFFEKTSLAGFAATFLNAMPVWRTGGRGHGLAELRHRLLAERTIYILFPEGTRTRTGKMAAFKPGIGKLVAGTSVPVVPCYLSGTFEALPPGRIIPRPTPIVVRVGKPLTFSAVADERAGWQQIAADLQEAVSKLHQ